MLDVVKNNPSIDIWDLMTVAGIEVVDSDKKEISEIFTKSVNTLHLKRKVK